jgi:hypothetical protein
MKKLVLLFSLVMTCIVTNHLVFAEEIIYVSNRGNEDNDGLSENTAKKSLAGAFMTTYAHGSGLIAELGGNTRKKFRFILTGTFDGKDDLLSYGMIETYGATQVYTLILGNDIDVIITGKPNANVSERAVISAKDVLTPEGHGVTVLAIKGKGKVRFEHIEISGGNGSNVAGGLFIQDGAEVTLGTGALIINNKPSGVIVDPNSRLILDGGEIKNNNFQNFGTAIYVAGQFLMNNGIISDNYSGGVGNIFVHTNGTFTMNGGIITANKTSGITAGGVFINTGATFIWNNGRIYGNIQPQGGSDLHINANATFRDNHLLKK